MFFMPGTFFNCIMFMVAGSCIATVMVLNFHHRLADTHEMPDWVRTLQNCTSGKCYDMPLGGGSTEMPQVSTVFLQWAPWILRMQRPGQKITRKTIMMHKKMKDLDKKDIASKSLLVNVMDMEDDFRWGMVAHSTHHQPYLTLQCFRKPNFHNKKKRDSGTLIFDP